VRLKLTAISWVVFAAVSATLLLPVIAAAQQAVPKFQPEPFWPKPLPENWILGQVAGIAVDPEDNIWIIHRPATLLDDEKGAQTNPPETKCCKAAPPVLKFDPDGNLLASWGGPTAGQPWVKNEHGIHVDRDGNVWLGGNNDGDQILKFTPAGKFLQQVGKDDGTKGSLSQTRLGRPAHMMTDPDANELYVADGYGNHRVIVFDSKTGAFKRMWGAYGKPPSDDKMAAYKPDAKPSEQFSNPVHCVRLSNDGLVYVCDRANDRIQVFRKDGTFVKEFRVTPETLANGSVWDLVLSEDAGQKFIFMADGANGQIVILSRETGEVLSQWGRHGRQPGQFKWVHNIAVDSKGNLYTAEVGFGRRAQKFRRVQ
jgi:DNA-binding beta-propeller fold protein YncE